MELGVRRILQNTLATVIGLFIGMMANMLIIQINTQVFFPLPPGLDMNNASAFNQYLQTLPGVAFFVAMLAHLSQAFLGAVVASRLAVSKPMWCALVVGGLSLCGGIWAMALYDGPPWMYLELPLFLLLAERAAAWHLSARRQASATNSFGYPTVGLG